MTLAPLRIRASLTVLPLLIACGGDTNNGATIGTTFVTPDPCQEELAGLCGAACSTDSECSSGLFCRDDGTCGAECTEEGAQCMGTCEANGECDGTLIQRAVIPTAGSEQDLISEDPTASNGGQECIEVVSGFDGVTPTVMIVVDRSGSMDQNFDMGRDRWETVRQTLTDPNDGIIRRLEGSVRFGLMLYTSVNPPGTNSTTFDECPMLVDAPIGLNNFATINTTYSATELIPGNGNGFQGHTPTGESLQAATASLTAFTEPGPKVIVLATDGDPDNCMDGDDHSRFSQQLSLDAVNSAFDQGIRTFVISVGDDAGEEHLQELAVAGQGDPSAEAYSALSTVELEAAFANIVGGVRSCSFALQGEVPDFHAPNGVVTLGGQPLTFDDPNGWALVNGNTVEIRGTACENLLSGTDEVNITFPCVVELGLPR